MLIAYYDIYYKERFNEIFQKTYILNNPTEEQGKYYILKFDFSSVSPSNYEETFIGHIELKLKSFVEKYKLKLKFGSKDIINSLFNIFMKSIIIVPIICSFYNNIFFSLEFVIINYII